MKWFLRFFITSCISISLAVGLSFLPELNSDSMLGDRAMPVQGNLQISNQNLVDYMVQLPIHLDLYKVSWEHHTLSLDLVLEDTLYSKKAIQQDLFEICYFGLTQVNNIQDIRVRIMLKGSGDQSSQLVMAMEMKPTKNAAENLKAYKQGEKDPLLFLQSHTSLTYTSLWKNLNPS
jgi:hypothetical protein